MRALWSRSSNLGFVVEKRKEKREVSQPSNNGSDVAICLLKHLSLSPRALGFRALEKLVMTRQMTSVESSLLGKPSNAKD